MQCQFTVYAMTSDRKAYGADVAVAKCTTHNWIMDYPISDVMLCPIGRIEQARDQAIAAIHAEQGRISKDFFK